MGILSDFLGQFPPTEEFLSNNIPLDVPIDVILWDMKKIEVTLEKWRALFDNLPGYDFCPFSYFVDEDNPKLLRQNVQIVAVFAASMAYNKLGIEFEVHLMGDGTARFLLPSVEEAEKFPQFYNFNGSWKDAYLILIDTILKGWPKDELPIELQKFVKS